MENSGRELVLINLHMESDEGENGQKEQTEMLFEFMRQEYERGNYVVAGGDFNQVFPEDDFSAYPLRSSEYYEPDRLEGELLDDGWLFVSDLSVPTCRLLNQPYHPDDKWSTQYYVIDGFILSPNLSVDEVETIDAGFEFADHNPVRLKIQLNEE